MPVITRLILQNFKKFPRLDLFFNAVRNIFIGDNESGKSSILLALDLVLSDSRHRVETLGVESLISQSAVENFLAGERRADLLPVLIADVFLHQGNNPDLNGRQNLARTFDKFCSRIRQISPSNTTRLNSQLFLEAILRASGATCGICFLKTHVSIVIMLHWTILAQFMV